MTMREEFEAWAELYLPNDESPRKIALAAWQAAYRAGQEAMIVCFAGTVVDDAEAIRALPLDDQP